MGGTWLGSEPGGRLEEGRGCSWWVAGRSEFGCPHGYLPYVEETQLREYLVLGEVETGYMLGSDVETGTQDLA